MEIPKRLSKWKFHFLFGAGLSVLIFIPFYLPPKVIDVVAFFGPLFLSTALFLLAVLVFGRTLPLAADAPGEKAAEVILDLVTSQPVEAQVHVHPSVEEDQSLIRNKQTEEEQVLIRNKRIEEAEEQLAIRNKQTVEEEEQLLIRSEPNEGGEEEQAFIRNKRTEEEVQGKEAEGRAAEGAEECVESERKM